MELELVTFRVLSDNYAYLVRDPETGAVASIDVADAGAVQAELDARGWHLTDILLTHHHWDHTQGAQELAQATGAKITGAAADAARLPKLDLAIAPGDSVKVGAAHGVVIAADGHTKGHIAFHFPGAKLAFTADSLMALGCGRVNPEGSYDMQFDTLARLAALPDDTLICSGHEYGRTNARFARDMDPDNPALAERAARIEAGGASAPSTLAEEKATNPFLRLADPALRTHLELVDASDRDVFAALRDRRNGY